MSARFKAEIRAATQDTSTKFGMGKVEWVYKCPGTTSILDADDITYEETLTILRDLGDRWWWELGVEEMGDEETEFMMNLLDLHGVSLEILQLIGLFLRHGVNRQLAPVFIDMEGELENLGQFKMYMEHTLWRDKPQMYDP